MKEKRKYKRYNKEFDVTYSCAKGSLIIEGNAKSKDVSAGGMRIPVDEVLKVSDRLRLAINLPWRRNPIDAIAKVVWASPRLIDGEQTVERDCGLEFTWVSAPDLGQLLNSQS